MTKKYEVKLAFANFRKGDIVEPAALLADHLKNRGYIVEVKGGMEEQDELPTIERATVTAPETPETPQRRGRGRPRKVG